MDYWIQLVTLIFIPMEVKTTFPLYIIEYEILGFTCKLYINIPLVTLYTTTSISVLQKQYAPYVILRTQLVFQW
jgi:hypothetical protein